MSAPPPDPPRPSAGVEPSAIQDAAGFAAALTELRARAGLTIREVSRRTGIPSATLGGYFSGRHLPPPTQPAQLAELLTALGVPAVEHDEWRTALNRIRRVPGPRTAGKVVPYRGLESYGVRDAAWFVGREALVDQLQSEVAELLQDEKRPRLLTLVGASGTGKSSLLRAGLMARMAAEGVTPVLLAPGGDPQRSLSSALARFRPGTRKRLVVVDQLEEVFAERVTPSSREEFLCSLVELAQEPATVVVAALRADFYGHAVAEPTLLPLLRRRQMLVGPMGEESLRRVVLEPALRAGATVEPELVELILRDLVPRGGVPEASALPMMSHALLATWKHARNGRLGVSDYVAVGGVAGAVQRTAEQVYGELDQAGRRTARWLFSQLVNVDEEGVVTRRRLEDADLEGDDGLPQVVEAFVAGRILSATDHTLEISHEVLLTAWPRLSEWLAADRDALRLRRRVSVAAAAWEDNGRAPAGLLRGGLLELARPLAESSTPGLTAVERAFVAESLAHAQEHERNQLRRRLGLRSLFAIVAVLALVATLVSVYLVRAVDEADEELLAAEDARNRALSRQVAVQADEVGDTAPELGMQLALAAYELAPTFEARSRLLSVSGAPMVSRLTGPEGPMRVAVSPDGTVLAAAGADGAVRFWSQSGDAAPQPLAEVEAVEGGELVAAAFSPDGRLFASAGAAGVGTVVDVRDPADPVVWPEPLSGPESGIQSLAFDGDGSTLYAGAGDPAMFRWALGTEGSAEPLRTVTAPFDGAVQGVAVSPTGLVAAGSADGFVRVWRERGGVLLPQYKLSVGSATNSVHAVAFSPDGRTLAAGSKDRRVRVWDTATGRLVTDRLDGFGSEVSSVAFSRDGQFLAAGASGGSARIWRTGSWQLHHELAGPATFTSVEFTATGSGLVTGAIDGTARVHRLGGPRLPSFGDDVWGLAAPEDGDVVYVGVGSTDPQVVPVDVSDPLRPRPGTPLPGAPADDRLDGVVGVSPDGSTVAAGTAGGRVVVWQVDAQGGHTVLDVLEPAADLIEDIAFSADGTTFAVSSDDGTTTVFALAGGRTTELAVLETPSLAMGVAVNPDGSLVAVGGADKLVRLWRLDGAAAQEVATLEGFADYVPAAAFSPDGGRLAAGSADGTVRVWDVTDPATPTPVGKPLVGPTDTVFGLSFDPEGELLAAASSDGALWVWSLDEDGGRPYARLESVEGGLHQALFRPSGRVFAGGAAGQVTSWLTDVDAVEKLVCDVAGSPITEDEWTRHVPGAPYEPPCA